MWSAEDLGQAIPSWDCHSLRARKARNILFKTPLFTLESPAKWYVLPIFKRAWALLTLDPLLFFLFPSMQLNHLGNTHLKYSPSVHSVVHLFSEVCCTASLFGSFSNVLDSSCCTHVLFIKTSSCSKVSLHWDSIPFSPLLDTDLMRTLSVSGKHPIIQSNPSP